MKRASQVIAVVLALLLSLPVAVVLADGVKGSFQSIVVADNVTIGGVLVVPGAESAVDWDNVAITGGTIDNVTLQGVPSSRYDPTSSIQTQINTKAPSASPTFTGTVTIPTPFTLGAVSVTPTGTEINFVDGVTSSVQDQLDAKAPLVSPSFTTPNIGAAVGTSLDTGQGAHLLYHMDQDVATDNDVTFNTVTAEEFISSATDNTRGVSIPNSDDPVGAYLSLGKCWFNTTENQLRCRNGDNTVTLPIGGALTILDNVAAPTAAQMYNSWNVVNADITVMLPTAVKGMGGCVQDSGSAHDVIVDVQGTDDMTLVGVEDTNGDGLTNAGGSSAGDYICVFAPSNGHWTATISRGTWAAQ